METITSIVKNEVKWQNDFSAAVDELGAWTASQSYICNMADIATVQVAKGTTHTLLPFLVATNASIQTVSDTTFYKVTINYGGINFSGGGGGGGGGGEGEVVNNSGVYNKYTMSTVNSEQPIEAHAMYKDFTVKQWLLVSRFKKGIAETVKDKTGNGVTYYDRKFDESKQKYSDRFEITSTDLDDSMKDLIARLDRGETHFKEPQSTWTKRYVTYTTPTAYLNKVGKIDDAEQAPSLNGDRDWLMESCNYDADEETGILNVEIVWIASGRKGWDSEVYS